MLVPVGCDPPPSLPLSLAPVPPSAPLPLTNLRSINRLVPQKNGLCQTGEIGDVQRRRAHDVLRRLVQP